MGHNFEFVAWDIVSGEGRTVLCEYVDVDEVYMQDAHNKQELDVNGLSERDFLAFKMELEDWIVNHADVLAHDAESAYWDRKIDESREG